MGGRLALEVATKLNPDDYSDRLQIDKREVGRAVADDRQYGIDRDDPADEERDRQQSVVAHHAEQALRQRREQRRLQQPQLDADQAEKYAVSGKRESHRKTDQQEDQIVQAEHGQPGSAAR